MMKGLRLAAIFFVVALGLSVFRAHRVPSLSGDQSRTLAAGRRALDGGGLQEAWAILAPDVSLWCRPFLLTPPLTPIVMGAADRVLRSPLRVYFFVNVLGALLFFGSWFFLSRRLLGRTRWSFALFWLWWIVVDPLEAGRPDDALAAGLLFSGLALVARLMDAVPAKKWRAALLSIGAGLLIASSGCIRYAYWCLVPTVPALAVFVAWRRRRLAYRWMLLMAAVALLPVLAAAAYNFARAGNPTFLDGYKDQLGIFWGHLLRMESFPSQALGFHGAIGLMKNKIVEYEPVARWMNLCVSIAILFLTVAVVKRRGVSAPPDDQPLGTAFLWSSGLVIGVMTVAMLSFLTVRYSFPLTSVSEARYYIPIAPFLLAAVIAMAMDTKATRILRFGARAILILSSLGIVRHYSHLSGATGTVGFVQTETTTYTKVGEVLALVPRDRDRVYIDIGLNDIPAYQRGAQAMLEGYFLGNRYRPPTPPPVAVSLVFRVNKGTVLQPGIFGVTVDESKACWLGSVKDSDFYWIEEFGGVPAAGTAS